MSEIVLSKEDDVAASNALAATPTAPPTKPIIELADEGDTLRDNYWNAIQSDPDKAAQIVKLSRQFGEDPTFVQNNLPKMQASANAPPDDYWPTLEKSSPLTAKYLKDQQTMSFAKDDIPNLSKVEKVLSGWRKGSLEGQLQNAILPQLDAALNGVPRESIPGGDAVKDLKDKLGPYRQLDAKLGKTFQPLYQTAAQAPNITRAFFRPELLFNDMNPMDAFGPAAQSAAIGVVAGAAGGAAVGAGAGAVAGGVGAVPGALGGMAVGATRGLQFGVIPGLAKHAYNMEATMAFDEYRDLKDKAGNPIDIKAAATAARNVGLVNAGLETAGDLILLKVAAPIGKAAGGMIAAPALKIISKIPGADKLLSVIHANPKIFVGKTLGTAIREAGKLAALGIGGEVTTEYLQEVSTGEGRISAIDNSGQDFAEGVKPTQGQVFDQALGVVKPTFESMLLPALLGSGSHVYNSRLDIQRIEQATETYRSVKDAVNQSQALQRVPGETGNFIGPLVQGTDMESVSFPVDAWDKHFQSANINPEDAANELGVGNAYKDAQTRGGDLTVPFSVWVDKMVKSDHYSALEEDVRIGDMPTKREIREQIEVARKSLLEEANAVETENPVFRDEREQIHNDIYEKVVKAGRSDKEARYAADIWAARAVTEAKRRGITPADWYRGGPEVVNQAQSVQAAAAQAPTFQQVTFFQDAAQAKDPKAEFITQAALRLGDKVFFGKHHGEAMEAMDRAGIPSLSNLSKSEDGFVTNTGRFVSRKEALKIAEKQGQLVKPQSKTLDSDALDSYYKQDAAPNQTPSPIPGPQTNLKNLPVVNEELKTGEPYAVFSFNWSLGKGYPSKAHFKVFGDPGLIRERTKSKVQPSGNGWASDLPLETIQQAGIPIVGKSFRAKEDINLPDVESHEQAAFHGSPHDFDKFSLQKIGTGEGAQVYGWGLYFAGKKEVAEYYKNTLAPRRFQIDGKNLSEDSPIGYLLMEVMYGNRHRSEKLNPTTISEIDIQKAIAETESRNEAYVDKPAQIAYLKTLVGKKFSERREGKLYEVDIPEDSEYVDYDKPLSQQSDKVKSVLADAAEQYKKGLNKLKESSGRGQMPDDFEPTGEMLYSQIIRTLGNPKAASEFLASKGIAGIKYADEQSRDIRILSPKDSTSGKWVVGPRTGEASQQKRFSPEKEAEARAYFKSRVTNNYVVFDDKLVKVLAKHEQAGDNAPRGFIQFPTPSSAVINLLKADPSTFIHESAHYFLNDLHQFNKSGQGNEATVRDWKIVGDWMSGESDRIVSGIRKKLDSLNPQSKGFSDQKAKLQTVLKEIENRGGRSYVREVAAKLDFSSNEIVEKEIAGQMHEIFARGFERYLWEGKSPSLALTRAFAQFKRWLMKVYSSVQGLDVEMNDDVRGMMDRMLATDDEIDLARTQAGSDLGQIIPAGIDPAVAQKLQDMRDQAHEEAVRLLLTQQMEELGTENALRLKKEEATARIDATKQVTESPIQLSMEAINKTFKRDALKIAQDYWVNKGLTEEQRQQFETLAEMRGFASADELAKKIIDELPVERQVQERVDLHMAQFTNLKDTSAIKDEAIKAIHNEMQTELLALEQTLFETLVQEAKGRKVQQARARILAKLEAGEAKRQAQATLSAKPYGEARRYLPYFTAERAAAVKAAKALQNKDYVAAAHFKRQQMLNHALATEAIKIDKEVDKTLESFKKLARRKQDLLDMPYGFVRQIDQLLTRHGLSNAPTEDVATYIKMAQQMATEGTDPRDIANASGMVQDDKGNWGPESLEGMAARINDNYYSFIVPQSVLSAQAVSHRQLTLEQLRDLKTTVKSLYDIGRTFERFLSDFIKVDLKTAAREAATSVTEKVGTPYAIQRTIGHEASKVGEMINALTLQPGDRFLDLVNLVTLSRYLDGGADNGPMTKYVYRPLSTAENKKLALTQKNTDALNSLLNKYFTPKEFAALQEKKTHFDFLNERKPYLTGEEKIAIALNWGNEGNRNRIMKGFQLQESQIMDIINTLSKKELDFVQATWDYLDSFWPQIVALEQKAAGVQPKKVANAVMETVHGTYRGGYYPLAYDFEKSSEAHRNAEQNNALFKQYSAAAAHTDHGHTQARVTNLDRAVRLELNVLFNHLDNIIHDLAYREAVIDVNRFLSQRELRESLQNAVGGKGLRVIEDNLKSVASDQGEFLTGIEKTLRFIRMGLTMSRLGWRVITIPMDLSSNLWTSLQEVGPQRLGHAITTFLDSPTDKVAFVNSLSERMKNRATLRDRDSRAVAKAWFGKDSWYARTAFITMSLADMSFSYPLWLEVYNNNAHLGQETAIHLADETVTRSFGSGAMLDQSAIAKGGEFQKMWTTMYGWAGMMFNRAWLGGKIAGLEYDKKNYGNAAYIVGKTVLYTWILQSLSENFWREFFRNAPDGVDEEKRKKRILGRFINQPLSYVPGLGSVLNNSIDKALGNYTGQSGSPLAAFGAIDDVLQPLADVTKAIWSSDHSLGDHFWEHTAKAGASVTGSPMVLNTLVFNFMDWLNSEGEYTWRDLVTRRTKS